MKYIAVLFLVTLSISCNSSEDRAPLQEPFDYSAINEDQINTYLTANNLVSLKTSNGLHYIIENQGDGEKPSASSNVTVAYKGYFLDGTVFDESTEGLSIGLNQVITGWTEGIPLFNEGGNGILLIPAHLGYGSFDYSTIPGGSVLVFDISLLSVN
ncbi:FKBP-type peptidyl-prolyl cis-trans isomerase [Maribacter hydrothermalis]|uniref:Peptidyl-prolyl cis-trans isomerase n=1 Tax=Maribacter hydrothermalis TaxID=1836467 RepID=A0A1B7Z890_9FLAO|nr:FKBP-type peptidyl-prolyl cis-trans isomerase [Maribacter hydrothermalis]APQ19064.1 peptidylprolyl isomerase [Maribacter hydrothermalis]OBR38924.1 peptidylprolyl isomerase [Maribacter hydrothermalis]